MPVSTTWAPSSGRPLGSPPPCTSTDRGSTMSTSSASETPRRTRPRSAMRSTRRTSPSSPRSTTARARGRRSSGGIDLRYSNSHESEQTILGVTQPYGTGQFGSVGLRMGLELDSRARPRPTTSGTWEPPPRPGRSRVRGERCPVRGRRVYRPNALDVESSYGQMSGVLSGYVGSNRVVLAARVGGQHLSANIPGSTPLSWEATTTGASGSSGSRETPRSTAVRSYAFGRRGFG